MRDPFGVKPLYYVLAPNRLAFASELRPLLDIVPREVDRESLATLLTLRFSPSPDTLFKGVRKLRPGHVLEVSLGDDAIVAREYPYITPRSGAGLRKYFPTRRHSSATANCSSRPLSDS